MTLIITDDLTLESGTALYDSVVTVGGPLTLVNDGLIAPETATDGAAVSLTAGTGLFRNTGSVLQQTGQPALIWGAPLFDVINSGQISWLASLGAPAILSMGTGNRLTNDGTITAAASLGGAIGLTTSGGLDLTNHGRIEVQSPDSPIAIDLHGDDPVHIVNHGAIQVTLADVTIADGGFASEARAPSPAQFGTAIRIAYDANTDHPIRVENKGNIIAHRIIDASGSTDAAVTIINTGTMVGAVILADADEIVTNRGLINGSVSLGAGDDVFDGGQGTVTGALFGGAGNDNLTIGSFAVPVYGGAGDDAVTGAGDMDWLSGGAGDDVLNGGANVNHLHGGAGADRLIANSANFEEFYGGAGSDLITGTLADLHRDKILDLQTEDIIRVEGTLLSEEDIDLGKLGKDTILRIGTETELYITGRAKKATITQGDDYTDISFGKAPKLKAVWQIGSGATDRLDGLKGDDRLEGLQEDDFLDGAKGDDRLFGGDGNDTLIGGKGADTLEGGAGDDILTGGKQADIFFFSSGHDRITDFDVRHDLIGLFGDDIDIADLVAQAHTDDAGHTILTLSNADSLTFEDFAVSSLTEDLFFLA